MGSDGAIDHLPRDRHTVVKPDYSSYRERFSDPDDSPALRMLTEKLIEVADDVAYRCNVREQDWDPPGTPNTLEKAIEMGRVDGLAYWVMTLEPIINELRKEEKARADSQEV